MLKSHFSPAQDIFTSPPIPPPPPPLHFISKKKSFHTPNCSTSDRRHITSRCLQNTIPDVSSICFRPDCDACMPRIPNNTNLTNIVIIISEKLILFCLQNWWFGNSSFIVSEAVNSCQIWKQTNKPFSPVKCELFFVTWRQNKISSPFYLGLSWRK